jgi:hypothetical protein
MLQKRRALTIARGRIFDHDPHRSTVVVHLTCEGPDGSTTFVDKSPTPKTFTGAGSTPPTIFRRRSRWGGGASFQSSNNDRVTTPDSADFDFGTGLFTVLIYCLPEVDNSDREMLAHRVNSDGNNLWLIRKTGAETVRVFARTGGVTTVDITTTTLIPWRSTNRMGEIMVRRNPVTGLTEIAFNRVIQPLSTTVNTAFGAWPNAATQLIVGNGDDSFANAFLGYFQRVIVNKGASRSLMEHWRLRQRGQPYPTW